MSLLVVAGEASGDRAAAQVLAHLPGVRAFGLGGAALEREGTELVADLRDLTALGFADVAFRAYGIGLAYAKIRAAIAMRSPRAALLVNYTEFNTRIARVLWRRGVRVLWYGAPQIWAWRAGRADDLRRHVDRMAVMLPFEEELWRTRGVDAFYVGHPALEECSQSPSARVEAREMLGMTPRAPAVAILPGSRPHEVKRLVVPLLEAYESVRRDRASLDGRLLLAPSLDERTRAFAREHADQLHVDVVEVDARAGLAPLLPAFDVSLCASGTASLECALARTIPVVCYRLGAATEAFARALVTTPFVALPNVLLGRAAFPELLQRDATPTKIAEALSDVLDERGGYLASCEHVETALRDQRRASLTVANMLEPWLL